MDILTLFAIDLLCDIDIVVARLSEEKLNIEETWSERSLVFCKSSKFLFHIWKIQIWNVVPSKEIVIKKDISALLAKITMQPKLKFSTEG